MKRNLIIVVVYLTVVSYLFAQALGESQLKALKAKYAKCETIDATFSYDGKKFNLKARKGGIYRLKHNSTLVITNGKTIWNINEGTKKVVIDNALSNNPASAFESLVFDVIQNSKLVKFTEEDDNFEFELLNPKSKNKIVITTNKSYTIKKIQMPMNGINQNITVHSFAINTVLNPKQFEYQPEKGYEVIDLR